MERIGAASGTARPVRPVRLRGQRGGEASEAARRVLRNVIVRSGGWGSSATDTYMRMQDAGVRLGDALLEGSSEFGLSDYI